MTIFFTFVLLFSQASFAKCETRALFAREQQNFPQDKAYITLADGTGYRNPRYQGPVSQPPTLRSRSRDEMKKIFDQVRNLLIAEISAGASEHALTEDQRLMIHRLRSQELQLRDCRGLLVAPGQNSLDSQITLCDHTQSAPSLSLVALIGHELGHAIDLQSLSSPMFRVKTPGVNFERILRAAHPHVQMPVDFPLALSEISRSKFFLEKKFTAEEMELLQTLISKGHIEIHDRGIPADRNPANTVFTCLKRYHGYRESSSAAPGQDRFMAETGAQIWGARAVARYLETRGPMEPVEALSLLAYSVSGFGKPAGQKELDMNAIYFSEPAVQTALKCEATENQNCMRYLQVGREAGTGVTLPVGR